MNIDTLDTLDTFEFLIQKIGRKFNLNNIKEILNYIPSYSENGIPRVGTVMNYSTFMSYSHKKRAFLLQRHFFNVSSPVKANLVKSWNYNDNFHQYFCEDQKQKRILGKPRKSELNKSINSEDQNIQKSEDQNIQKSEKVLEEKIDENMIKKTKNKNLWFFSSDKLPSRFEWVYMKYNPENEIIYLVRKCGIFNLKWKTKSGLTIGYIMAYNQWKYQ